MSTSEISDLTNLANAFSGFANSTLGLFSARVQAEQDRLSVQLGNSMTQFLQRFDLPTGHPNAITTANWSDELDKYNQGVSDALGSVESEPIRNAVSRIFNDSQNQFRLMVSDKMGAAAFKEGKQEVERTLAYAAQSGNSTLYRETLDKNGKRADGSYGFLSPEDLKVFEPVYNGLVGSSEASKLLSENGRDYDSAIAKTSEEINTLTLPKDGDAEKFASTKAALQAKLSTLNAFKTAADASTTALYNDTWSVALVNGELNRASAQALIASSDASRMTKNALRVKADAAADEGIKKKEGSIVTNFLAMFPHGSDEATATLVRRQVEASLQGLVGKDKTEYIESQQKMITESPDASSAAGKEVAARHRIEWYITQHKARVQDIGNGQKASAGWLYSSILAEGKFVNVDSYLKAISNGEYSDAQDDIELFRSGGMTPAKMTTILSFASNLPSDFQAKLRKGVEDNAAQKTTIERQMITEIFNSIGDLATAEIRSGMRKSAAERNDMYAEYLNSFAKSSFAIDIKPELKKGITTSSDRLMAWKFLSLTDKGELNNLYQSDEFNKPTDLKPYSGMQKVLQSALRETITDAIKDKSLPYTAAQINSCAARTWNGEPYLILPDGSALGLDATAGKEGVFTLKKYTIDKGTNKSQQYDDIFKYQSDIFYGGKK
jgi:hypothetical protein